MPSLLFVCSANQLRSPLAEVVFRSQLERRGLSAGWQVGSAGVWALEGSPAARAALQTAVSRGLNLAQHVARPVTEELLRGADLVLVMEREHLVQPRAAPHQRPGPELQPAAAGHSLDRVQRLRNTCWVRSASA